MVPVKRLQVNCTNGNGELRLAANIKGVNSALKLKRRKQVQSTMPNSNEKDEPEPQEPKKSLMMRFLQWLAAGQSDRRRSVRERITDLVVYYFTGGPPKAYRVGDVSDTGFYLVTDERPMLDVTILMTLQRTDLPQDAPPDSVDIYSKVVRWGQDGIGLEFVPIIRAHRRSSRLMEDRGADKPALERFLERLNRPRAK